MAAAAADRDEDETYGDDETFDDDYEILEEICYKTRPTHPDMIRMVAYSFGQWCNERCEQPDFRPPPHDQRSLQNIFDRIMRDEPGISTDTLAFIVGQYHTDPRALELPEERKRLSVPLLVFYRSELDFRRQPPDPTYNSIVGVTVAEEPNLPQMQTLQVTDHSTDGDEGIDNRIILSRISTRMIVACETYDFSRRWPARLDRLTHGAEVCPPAPNPARLYTWLNSVAVNMPSARIEALCRDFYCNIKIPVAIGKRSAKTAYEKYRDLDKIFSLPDFEPGLKSVAYNIPEDIVKNHKLACNPTVLVCASLAILKVFCDVTCQFSRFCDDGIALRSNDNAGFKTWMSRWGLHVTERSAWFSVGEPVPEHTTARDVDQKTRPVRLYKSASPAAHDIVWGYVLTCSKALPWNKDLKKALNEMQFGPPKGKKRVFD